MVIPVAPVTKIFDLDGIVELCGASSKMTELWFPGTKIRARIPPQLYIHGLVPPSARIGHSWAVWPILRLRNQLIVADKDAKGRLLKWSQQKAHKDSIRERLNWSIGY
jgi:hypothetical protein